jgi:AraC family transcriptional regulator of adaptative response / DNA-3-methyladenine glycosylase II
VRRFNDAMRAAYRRPPSELRRHANGTRRVKPLRAATGAGNGVGTSGGRATTGSRAGSTRNGATSDRDAGVVLGLTFRPPYDWDALLGFLAQRAVPGVESVRDGVYRRTFRLAAEPGDDASEHRDKAQFATGFIEVRCEPAARRLRARVCTVGSARLSPRVLLPVVTRLRRQFDLLADPSAITATLGADPFLARCVKLRPGLRVPGAWDGFELAVRAVLGQQVSVRAATTIAGRLARAFGAPITPTAADPTLAVAFPTAAALASADVGALTALGLTRARAQTLNALAAEVAAGRLDLDPGADIDATLAALTRVTGIGAWTAEYIAMRALRAPDAFPTSDLGLRRAFARLAASRPARNGRVPAPARPAALEDASQAWKPWRAYAALHLWTWEVPHAAVDG